MKDLSKKVEKDGVKKYEPRERETLTLFAVKHKNVVKISGSFPSVDHSIFYHVLEFCDYDLSQILGCRNIKFSFPEIKTILKQLFEGLSHIHQLEVMHRASEVLLLQRNYGTAVDMWAAGCVMVEMFTRIAILPGESEINQLDLITSLSGSINSEFYPDSENLPAFASLRLPRDRTRKISRRSKVGAKF
ncbi:hypothetical protein JTE90_025045 [Oedothorax gibbosus]|uniref:Protein kinase domain-containing protein n=1 Tax=Oedothorax gibbosus TaxID=931172 RepID=A0AAV6TRQ3_9ARAC|nr:hypothetical protein JTE90_025045 [Oedothorax gibbosus]